jgi:ATP-dependent DNA helicase RecQ
VTTPVEGAEHPGSERALFGILAQLRRIADTLEHTPAEAAEQNEPEANSAEEQLFQELRKWRAEEARKLGMPPYIVATDKVLRAVVASRPATEEDLRNVPGFGPAKAAKYGPGLLEVVAAA